MQVSADDPGPSRPVIRIFGAIETMNRYHGLTAGFEAGELFMTYRSVGVDDLMRWASPAHARS